MANKELANQRKHGCMHEIYAWNDLGTPTSAGIIKCLCPQLTIVNDSGNIVNVTLAAGSTGCAFDAPYSVNKYR